jgi:hypothetical protein
MPARKDPGKLDMPARAGTFYSPACGMNAMEMMSGATADAAVGLAVALTEKTETGSKVQHDRKQQYAHQSASQFCVGPGYPGKAGMPVFL